MTDKMIGISGIASGAAIMKVKPLRKTYEGRKVLDTDGFGMQSGRIYMLIGANGCGKSTLAKIIAGVEKADERGRVMEFHEPAQPGGDRHPAVTYVPQKPYAFRMSLEKNLRIVADDREREQELIDKLGLDYLRNKRTEKFSGGETARMALARALMRDTDLLILDEVTAAMDMESNMAAEQVVAEHVRRSGTAVLMITHNIQQAYRMGDELIFMKQGKIVETGSCTETLQNPKTQELKEFLEFYGANI